MVTHIPVLLDESVKILSISPGETIVDGTFGGGGHSTYILKHYSDIHLICVDLDEDAQIRFQELIGTKSNVIFVHKNFKDAEEIIELATEKKFPLVTKVLLDLGTSTFQLLSDTRGFSFASDAPLSMAFSKEGSHTGFTAYDIVNSWEESSIADIIYGYGEEHNARRIAKAIIEARKEGTINTSKELATIISDRFPRRGRIHPATKTFQALRIAVNDELQTIQDALNAWWNIIPSGGRIAVITFHSLEDRIVKQWMKEQNGTLLSKKPIPPTLSELQLNPRARSAKLRGIEKL
jgi:16S rRNA (cytosine1402-N4)-methyltransferase